MQMISFSCVTLLLTYLREVLTKTSNFYVFLRQVPPHSVVMYYVFRLTTSVSRIFDGILEGGQWLKRYEQWKKICCMIALSMFQVVNNCHRYQPNHVVVAFLKKSKIMYLRKASGSSSKQWENILNVLLMCFTMTHLMLQCSSREKVGEAILIVEKQWRKKKVNV